jgi:hypothetical protein
MNEIQLTDRSSVKALACGNYSIRCRIDPPFFCELLGQNGQKILLGIGGPKGCVQHSNIDGSPPYLMAVSENPEHQSEHVDFLIGGTLTPVPAHYCVPFQTVSEITTYFQMTGERSPMVAWEEV